MHAKITRYSGIPENLNRIIAILSLARQFPQEFTGILGGVYDQGAITYQFYPTGTIIEIETWFENPDPIITSLRHTMAELITTFNFTTTPLN